MGEALNALTRVEKRSRCVLIFVGRVLIFADGITPCCKLAFAKALFCICTHIQLLNQDNGRSSGRELSVFCDLKGVRSELHKVSMVAVLGVHLSSVVSFAAPNRTCSLSRVEMDFIILNKFFTYSVIPCYVFDLSLFS